MFGSGRTVSYVWSSAGFQRSHASGASGCNSCRFWKSRGFRCSPVSDASGASACNKSFLSDASGCDSSCSCVRVAKRSSVAQEVQWLPF